MNWLGILALSVGLAMDAFAVSISTGLNNGRLRASQVLRLASAFGLFQCVMPLIGWSVGHEVALLIGAFDHWIAFGLLAAIGGKMVREALYGKEAQKRGDPTRGVMLLVLALATSIDALAVGLSLAFLRVPIVVPSVVIGIVTASLSATGAAFGSRIGRKWGTWAEVAGGCVLIVIGIQILITHLTGS